MSQKRLLILSCSQRKRPDPGLLPAIERYDGPQFQVLRKYLREQSDESLFIYILSAQFGLIAAQKEITYYNHKMTARRADQLQPRVIKTLNDAIEANSPINLFISLGKVYWLALGKYQHLLPNNLEKTIATGSQGRRQAELWTWLYNSKTAQDEPAKAINSSSQNKVRLRGIDLKFTPDEVLQLAREKLRKNKAQAASYQSWYVVIDDMCVAPKWLVSQLSGLPVSAFHTGDARRVLQQLGIKVRHL